MQAVLDRIGAGLPVDQFANIFNQLLKSSGNTLLLFAFTLLISLPLGLAIALGRMSKFKPIQIIIRAYLLIMRGTPLMLQIIFFFYGLPLSAYGLTRLQVAIMAFSLNYAAYFAEIYRGGIESVPKGQWEAANVLGFSKAQSFFRIILPQVIKRITPPMGNEFMTLVKDTSLAKVIGVIEITRAAEKLQTDIVSIVPIIIAGIFYLIMNSFVSKGFSLAEKRLSYYN